MEAQGSAVAGQEVLSAVERLEERVLLGMRLRNGFDLHEVSQQVGLDARSLLKPRLQELAAQGVLCLDDERVCLNSQWLAMADAVTRRVLADLG
jgi:coproporphyrinogen III oxidase-like Fe-S oxidoreductase